MNLNYNKRIEICLSVSIIIIIFIFYFFPVFYDTEEFIEYYTPVIVIEQIPRTMQSKKKLPPPLRPVIPKEAFEDELMDDLVIDSIAISPSDSNFFADFSKGIPLDYKPRQILEVIPENINSNIKGEIILLLKIGKNGKMLDYKVVSNTIKLEKALINAINAAKKSRWEAGMIGKKLVEYWIEKSYKFNL